MILFPMMFGILQYGLYFNDAMQLRQGIREAARAGAVQGSDGSCGTPSASQIKCIATAGISPVTGHVAVHVAAPDGWKRGDPLIVCGMVASAGGSAGILPMPNGGVARAETQMSIEQDDPVPAGTFPDFDPPLPDQDWSWCS